MKNSKQNISDECKSKMSIAAKVRDRSSQTGIYHWSKKITINGITRTNKEWVEVFEFDSIKEAVDFVTDIN